MNFFPPLRSGPRAASKPSRKKQIPSSDNLLDCYQTKPASLDELKKSILQKAFAGELT
ncbi:hypothetical protein V2O64_16865 [Verrucomicrobiaceae bacterium 227]